MKTFIFVFLSLHGSFSFASAPDCTGLMSSLQSVDGSSTYLNLIKHLVKEKNAISALTLREMSEQKSIPNTMDFVSSSLTSEDRYAFKKAFERIKNINWESVREKLKNLAQESRQDENQRQEARDNTRFIYAPIPIHSPFENRNFANKEFFDSPSGLAFVGYERNRGTYFIDLNTDQERLVNTEYEQTTFVRMKNGLGVIARNNTMGEIFVEEAITGKPMAKLNVSDLFPNFPRDSLEGISIKIYERSDGNLRLIGEKTAFLPGTRGVYDFSPDGGHGFFVSDPLESGTGIYTLRDGTILKYMGEWKEELELKELSGVLRSKPLLKIKTPIELSLPTIRPTDTTPIKGKFLEMVEGPSFYMAYNHKGFVIYDLKTLQGKIVKPEEPLFLSQWGRIIEVNGDLKMVDSTQMGSASEFKIGDFNGKVRKIEFGNTHIISFLLNPIRLHDGRTLVAIGTARPDGGALIKEVQLVDLATGSVQQIKFYNEKFTRLMALKELEGGEIVGFFLNTGNKIVATQLYGPIPGETP